MTYHRNSRSRRSSTGSWSRWMQVRYAGVCRVCGSRIAAGEQAYWDASARTVTCEAMACCEADGLTTVQLPTGPWDGPADQRITVRSDPRIGSAAPYVITTRFNSGAVVYQNSRGRCEDAPACGCCS
jgi:hypothetical protein